MGTAQSPDIVVRGRSQRWSPAQGLEFVEQWRLSGLKASEFCRERGVPPHRLSYWIRRRAGTAEGSCAAAGSRSFFALTVGAKSAVADPRSSGSELNSSIELRVGDRLAVCLGRDVSQEQFVQTLRWVLEALEV